MSDAREPATAGLPHGDVTMVEVLAHFRHSGWAADMTVTATGEIRCGACRRTFEPEDAEMAAIRRLEGMSDPADMAMVMGVRCPHCGEKGALVVHYGPLVEPGEERVLLALTDTRPTDPASCAAESDEHSSDVDEPYGRVPGA